MKKKVLSVILVAGMAASLLAGCGGTEAASGTEAAAGGTEAAATDDSSAPAEAAAPAADVYFDDNPVLKIKMANAGCEVSELDRIVEAMNEITMEEIGVTAEIEFIDLAAVPEQMNLMFSSQEACDIISITPLLPYSAMKGQNELMDISEYLDEYGQDILTLGDHWMNAYRDGDAIYGIPVNRDKKASWYINMRKDILDDLGLTEKAQNMSSWTEFKEILDAVKEANPDITPFYCSAAYNAGTFFAGNYTTADDSWANAAAIDNLGDANTLVYVEDGKVMSYFQSDYFKADCLNAKAMYDGGYVNSDATTAADDADMRVANNQIFSFCGGGESNNAAQHSGNAGTEIISVPICDAASGSTTVTIWGFGIPYTSEQPEAAVAWMNLLYTNEELANLFVRGQEGIDYEVTEAGTVPMEGAGYRSQTWLTGNALVVLPAAGEMSVEDHAATIESTLVSDYLGFFANIDNIETSVTACANAVNEYKAALITGAAQDPEAMIQELSDKLDAAGIADVVAEYQAQLDEWMANNQ